MGQTGKRILTYFLSASAAIALTGCDENGVVTFGQPVQQSTEKTEQAPAEIKTVEKDVESPEIFSTQEAALWDGRPSLGGIWVAHPDVTDPERVIIRNLKNGRSVEGALFRRERDQPGPRLQVSSEAATALGVVAGTPTDLKVVVLRRVAVPVAPPPQAKTDPIAAAGAALDDIDAKSAQEPQSPTIANPFPLTKPYLQVGLYTVEENANQAADALRAAGIVPSLRKTEKDGKALWRIVVGPTESRLERRELSAKIKDAGFTDVYAVTN